MNRFSIISAVRESAQNSTYGQRIWHRLTIQKLARCLVGSAALVFALTLNTLASTYYIDFNGGNDSNNGTSKNTSWKRHPYMTGWSGSYAHVAGDIFIFKGGVTWTSDCFPLIIATGGVFGNRDTYTTDNSWFNGGAWTRPVFDGGYVKTILIRVPSGTRHLNVFNFNLQKTIGTSNYGHGSLVFNGGTTPGADNVTLSNLWVHDWKYSSATDGQFGGIMNYVQSPSGGITNYLITHCDIGNPENGGNSGTCLWFPGEVAFSKLHDSPQGVLHGGASIHDCEFYNIRTSFDSAQHANVAYIDWPNGFASAVGHVSRFYNNYIHDCTAPEPIYPNASGGGEATFWIYNNYVVLNNAKTIDIDSYPGRTPMKIYIWNNTFVNPSGTHIRVTDRNDGQPELIVCRNNHFIGGNVYVPAETQSSIFSNNLTNSTIAIANAAGYIAANFYAPVTSNASVVGSGMNLSSVSETALNLTTSRGGYTTPVMRPPVEPWDIGAYQYGSISTTNPIIGVSPSSINFGSIITGTSKDIDVTVMNRGGGILEGTAGIAAPFSLVSGGTYTLGSNEMQTITISYKPTAAGIHAETMILSGGGGSAITVSGSATAMMPAMSFEAEAGTITGPFSVNNGSVYQTSQTDVLTGGRGAYSFSITNAGNYVIEAIVDAPSDAENSFFVNMDDEPQDPFMVWQIPVTAGFQNRTVSWQGTGTWNNPQFVPKVFNLTAGPHQLIVRGREANTRLDRIVVKKSPPTPPSGLRLVTP